MPDAPLLELVDVNTHIGRYHILHGVSMAVPAEAFFSCTRAVQERLQQGPGEEARQEAHRILQMAVEFLRRKS
jgi:hypothetical protein